MHDCVRRMHQLLGAWVMQRGRMSCAASHGRHSAMRCPASSQTSSETVTERRELRVSLV